MEIEVNPETTPWLDGVNMYVVNLRIDIVTTKRMIIVQWTSSIPRFDTATIEITRREDKGCLVDSFYGGWK